MFAHCEVGVFENRQTAKQAADLERADQARLDAPVRSFARDIATHERNRSGIRAQCAREQPNECGLACAVRADERATLASLHSEIDAICGHQRAEALRQPVCCEYDVAHPAAPRRCAIQRPNASAIPRMPPRANITTATNSPPMMNIQ